MVCFRSDTFLKQMHADEISRSFCTMKKFIQSTLDRQVADLQRLVRIPSVSRGEPPEEGKPFGKTVFAALETALDIARGLGFERVWHTDGYAGVIEYGSGKETVGILAHLDVVPEGEGWTYPPYGAEIHNGRVYGRGTLDDKGAAVSALYALAAVKELGLPMKRKVRIILGTDEEIGSLGVEHYLKTEGAPDLSFTPDAEYPVVNSEMGILQSTYHAEGRFGIRCSVGTAANVIPGVVTAVLPCEAKAVPVPDGFEASFSENTITVTGRGGHASMPAFAKNALLAMMDILSRQALPAPDLNVVTDLNRLWRMDMHGETLGLDVTDDSGRTTYSPDVFRMDESGVTFICDCRHPFSLTAESILDSLDRAYGGISFSRVGQVIKPGHFMPADSELVSTLMRVYNRINQSNAKPLTMGGGTYARELPNAVAFGIVREGRDNLCHVPDEYIAIDDLLFNTEVMAEAIKQLAVLEKEA